MVVTFWCSRDSIRAFAPDILVMFYGTFCVLRDLDETCKNTVELESSV